MSRGERSLTRLTSTWSITASKIFSRGECWYPIVTLTAWFFLYLWDLSPRRIVAGVAPPLHLSADDGGGEVAHTVQLIGEDRGVEVQALHPTPETTRRS